MPKIPKKMFITRPMPPEFPSSAQMLEELVKKPTDVQTERGRKGYIEMARYIQDLVNTHELGNCQFQKLTNEEAGLASESKLINIFIEAGNGDEEFLLQAHGDTIVPDPFYVGTGKNPLHCKEDSDDPDIMHGCGCGDNKIGVVAMLRALPELKRILTGSRRRAKILIDTAEEWQSQGIYAAKRHLSDIKWAATFDIPAGGKLGEKPKILRGRPGRVAIEVVVEALKTDHLGAVTDPDDPEYLDHRMGVARAAIKKVIPECHPDHPQPGSEEYGVTFPRSICLPHLSTMRNPLSMTMPARGVIKVEVLYTNATLTLAGIEEKIRKATEEALGDNRFSINREPRTTDFLKPWIERPDHPLVQSGLHHLRDITGDEVELAYGKPTANENVIANWGMPVITLPPDAEGEHSANERVRVSYVDEVMVPWILAMAGSERSHTHWQK